MNIHDTSFLFASLAYIIYIMLVSAGVFKSNKQIYMTEQKIWLIYGHGFWSLVSDPRHWRNSDYAI